MQTLMIFWSSWRLEMVVSKRQQPLTWKVDVLFFGWIWLIQVYKWQRSAIYSLNLDPVADTARLHLVNQKNKLPKQTKQNLKDNLPTKPCWLLPWTDLEGGLGGPQPILRFGPRSLTLSFFSYLILFIFYMNIIINYFLYIIFDN